MVNVGKLSGNLINFLAPYCSQRLVIRSYCARDKDNIRTFCSIISETRTNIILSIQMCAGVIQGHTSSCAQSLNLG